MKKIPKKLVDECIDASRDYWNPERKYCEGLLELKEKSVKKLSEKARIDWLAVSHFFDSILILHGLAHDAENDEIYCALRVLGWDVID